MLENNRGLLERDLRTNKPFYERFGIKCGDDLTEPDTQICYCLKRSIGRHFLTKMVQGELEKELGNTVLIVDEVDDLIVNERPNSNYVGKDFELTPLKKKCYETLLRLPLDEEIPTTPPEGVDERTWQTCIWDAQKCSEVQKGKHYRVIIEDGKEKAIMLDDQGQVRARSAVLVIDVGHATCSNATHALCRCQRCRLRHRGCST